MTEEQRRPFVLLHGLCKSQRMFSDKRKSEISFLYNSDGDEVIRFRYSDNKFNCFSHKISPAPADRVK